MCYERHIAPAGDLKKNFFYQFDCHEGGNLDQKQIGAFEKQGLLHGIQKEFVEVMFTTDKQSDGDVCANKFSLKSAACIENVGS